jgi:tetratricopeptide (TPR) repeat protein
MFWPFKGRTTWREHFDRGMTAGAAGDIETAVSHFRKAVHLAPLEPYPHYELGYSLFLLGQFEAALQELRRTNELAEGFFLVQTEIYMCEMVLSGLLNRDSLALVRQLQRLTDTGQAQSQEAVSLSRELVRRAPSCALGHYYLGKALFATEPQASEDALQRCLELHPDDTTAIDALTHIGSHRRAAGDTEGARAIWSGVVAKYKSNPHVKPTEAFFLRGSA